MTRELSVLVVDDNPGFRREIVAICEDVALVSRAQGMGSSDADIIASVLVSAKDTLLILDYDSMERATHGTTTQWLRGTTARIERESNVHVVILAKTSDEMLAVKMMKSGAADYFPKRLLSGVLLEKCLRQFADEQETPAPARRALVERAQNPKPEPLVVEVEGYEVMRKLYESREAEIHLARSLELGTTVVLKVVPYSMNSEQQIARFRREFKAIKRINNSCVATVYDFRETDRFAYMALEHFPCGSLKDRLTNPMPAERAVQYLRQIALALKQVHAADIVHRDLKPSNIMIRADNSIALIDFGIVKDVGEGTGLTRHGELRGSPYYMSPEQASGTEVDSRSDIYSLGVVFFEMLTGRRPYTGKDLMDVLSQHIDSPPPRLSGELSLYQPLIDNLMAKDREYRTDSIDELFEEQIFNRSIFLSPQSASQSA